MAIKGSVQELSKLIVQSVTDYTDDVVKEIKQESKKITTKAAQELKTAGSFKNRRGKYRKGWRVKSVKGEGDVVHNLTDYQLTHLLEKGHALRRGGRSVGHVAARVHIEPIEKKAVEDFEKAVERAIKR